MRPILRTTALVLVLLVLLMPLVAYAKGKPPGPCPDDPVASKNCNKKTPPYYVVTNRYEQHLWDRPGSGCQPFILKNPKCTDCANAADPACSAIDVNVDVCQAVMAKKGMPAGQVYEMCCNCAANPKGTWVYRIRTFDGKACPNPGQWNTGLPPGTGIDLPAPLIIGGLAAMGAGFLAAGVLVRRRTLRTA